MTLQLTMAPLHIPFRAAFRHAGAERAETETVIVTARRGGLEGVGEGCPRSYVSGESIASALAFFEQHHATISQLSTLDNVRHFTQQFQQEIDANPAAWCAVELALLDLLGKEQQLPIEALLSLPPITQPCHYSAVLSAGSADGFAKQLAQYQAQGFTQYKIKLSGDAALDAAYVAHLRAANIPLSHVRADANRLWPDAISAIAHLAALDYPFWALEDPLHAINTDALTAIVHARDCRIIIDEHFLRLDQFATLAPHGPWIINLRISKMGGLLRSMAIIQHAANAGIPLIIGAQVGETSILTRAAICVAQAAGTSLLAQEGAFGNLLLANDPCDPSLTFGPRGILSPHPAFSTPGMGINWQPEAL
jgi:L-alanine-DL-glutamate epimerase-like enolase superfamily enzyme